MTLTSDLVFRMIVSRAYLLYYLRKESHLASWMHLDMTKCHCALTLTSDLVSRNCFESGAYILYSSR